MNPNDCSSFLKESIKRLIVKDYNNEHTEKVSYETVYSKRYKTFCRKLNKKKKYYDSKHIEIVFVKLKSYDNEGFKAKVVRKKDLNKLSGYTLWEHSKNNDNWM